MGTPQCVGNGARKRSRNPSFLPTCPSNQVQLTCQQQGVSAAASSFYYLSLPQRPLDSAWHRRVRPVTVTQLHMAGTTTKRHTPTRLSLAALNPGIRAKHPDKGSSSAAPCSRVLSPGRGCCNPR